MSGKVLISIRAYRDGTFGVHQSGKSITFKDHGEAVAYAQRALEAAGGPEAAEIKDLTDADERR